MKTKKYSIINLDKFITKSLYEKNTGYYMSKNPFGKKGDFITSPNISIFFSEIIAIWIVSFWKNLKEPKKLNIIELGAGNGEMINIITRTLKRFPILNNICKIYILEKSPYLVKIQKKKIKCKKIFWLKNLNKIKDGPNIFLANEFFDALPVKQFLKKNKQWLERKVKFEGTLPKKFFDVKIDIKKIEKIVGYKISKNQDFLEISYDAMKYINIISNKINKFGGGILIIDYGYIEEKMKNTLRGIQNHKIVNILSNYKKCDITYSLAFNFFKKIGKKYKLKVSGLTTQGNFLKSLGIMHRAEIVSKNLPFTKKADIYYRINKLIDKKLMGQIFKVMLLTNSKTKFNIGFKSD